MLELYSDLNLTLRGDNIHTQFSIEIHLTYRVREEEIGIREGDLLEEQAGWGRWWSEAKYL